MEKKGIEKEVKLHFVLPDGRSDDEVVDCMKMAFQESKEAGLCPIWIKEGECSNIPPSKNTVFVMQEFNRKSEVFNKLRSTKSLVCGPMCLRSCLAENKPIPNNKSPVFTTAMRDLVVTTSQISVDVKADIKEKVSFMGGVYLSNLAEAVTHLVTNAVRSAKYEVAAEKGLPIMKVDWVDAVWQESQKRYIKATDPNLMVEYKCPIFYNMFIACSNLSKAEKEELKALVTKHGGTFTPTMRQSETTLLVLKEPQGVKYQHARSWDLPCVRPSYIYQSVEKGYAVPSKEHLVERVVKCSTPTKEDDLANFTYNSDPSISVINFDTNKTHVDDTQLTNFTQLGSQPRQPFPPSGNQYTHMLNTLAISDAKKSGSFVDGCKVYLSGFSGMDVEKLMRILSLGGATVFSELSESVSHVLLGEFIVDDMRALSGLAQKPHVVTLEWLAACIKQRAPVAEEPFYCLETRKVVPEPPSPLSQKGMQLLKPQFDSSETSKMPPPPEPSVNRKLFSEFLKENIQSPAKQHPSSVNQSAESQDSIMPDLFLGKKFLIVGYDSEVTENLEEAVDSAGGSVVAANFKGVADYAVVPLGTPVPNVTALEVVTYLWLDDCIENKEVMEMQYYYQPFSVDLEKKPLANCCLSFSSYSGREKTFLINLAEALGAVYQDSLVKVAKKKEDKELLPNTHLVCPKAEGKKYEAAAKWGLKIINKDWLLACARSNAKVAETSYTVTEEDSSSVNGNHTNISVKSSNKTPDLNVIDTPNPSSKPTFKTPTNPSVEDVMSACGPSSAPVMSACGTSSTPVMSACGTSFTPSNPTGDLETFQTPVLPHPTVNSLKRKSTAMTPEDQSPFHMSTPDTPYGQAIATPSASAKKRWKRFIDDFPTKPRSSPTSPKNSRRQSTPISELKRRAFALALETSEDNVSPNYSIQEMEEEPESEANHPNKNQTPSKISETIPSELKNAGSSHEVKNTNTSPPVKRSLENENVCKMLGQLHQRLSSTPNPASEHSPGLYRNYRQLVTCNNQPSTSKPVTSTILDPDSQPIVIGWDDPVETAERARVSSSSMSKPRKFVLSNVSEKEDCEKKLQSLGETVSSGVEFELDTTHLIVDKPVRSEKLLCCMAGGRWVLHPSFIDRMVERGKYVPEEVKYEWGNPFNAEQLPCLPAGGIGRELAEACYRWRKKVNESTDGAFKGMKAMFFTTPSKYGSYKRLVIAGGGVVLPSTMSSVSSATHCFVELNKVQNLSVPLSEFVAHSIPCLPPVFLGEMLTNPTPNLQDALIPEYKRLLALKQN